MKLHILSKPLLSLITLIESIESYFYPISSKHIQSSYNLKNPLSILSENSSFNPIQQIHKTKPYPLFYLKTPTTFLLAPDSHLISTKTSSLSTTSSLLPNQLIKLHNNTKTPITSNTLTNLKLSTYDITLKHKPHTYISNSIISHNTTTASIYNAWYTLFNYDKTTLIAANKFVTAKEIMNKTKNILEALPFFLKPGIRNYAQTQITTDANSKIIAESTTERTGIGFTIDNLFVDETAHLGQEFGAFYENLVPTISSLKNSKITLTSTQNGFNHYYDLWQGAIRGENQYNPIKIDYWQVPGRDENWKQEQIRLLGSEESFNRQYGTEFVAFGDSLLTPLSSKKLRDSASFYVPSAFEGSLDTLKSVRTRIDISYRDSTPLEGYLLPELVDSELSEDLYAQELFYFRLDFDVETLRDPRNRFVATVDISEGLGKDYSVINLFQVKYDRDGTVVQGTPVVLSDKAYLEQCGILRSNIIKIEDLARVLLAIYKVIGPDNLLINIEYNTYGALLIDKLFHLRPDFDDSCIAKHYHNNMSKVKKYGLRLNNSNKPILCNMFRDAIMKNRILINNVDCIDELCIFGKNDKGNYEGLGGNDDSAMSCIEVVSLFNNEVFLEMVEDLADDDEFDDIDDGDDLYDIF